MRESHWPRAPRGQVLQAERIHGVPDLEPGGRGQQLAAQGVIDSKDSQNIIDAFDLLAHLRWEKHLQDLQQGHDVTNLLDPMDVSGLARHQLKDGFAVINEAQSRLKHRFCRDM